MRLRVKTLIPTEVDLPQNICPKGSGRMKKKCTLTRARRSKEKNQARAHTGTAIRMPTVRAYRGRTAAKRAASPKPGLSSLPGSPSRAVRGPSARQQIRARLQAADPEEREGLQGKPGHMPQGIRAYGDLAAERLGKALRGLTSQRLITEVAQLMVLSCLQSSRCYLGMKRRE